MPVQILMQMDKETKNTKRFECVATKVDGEDVPGEACTKLYIQKWAMDAIEDADEIIVTIEASS